MAGGIIDMLAVGSGSFLGGVARYAVGRVLQAHATGPFPWGTLAVNIGGCLLIGILYGLIDKGMPGSGSVRLFLTAGFCGGFTTFSTFMRESGELLGGPAPWLAILYAGVSLALGLGALYLGQLITR